MHHTRTHTHIGFRLVAMTVLPINNETLCYGSSDVGVTVHDSEPALRNAVQQAATKLNLAPHKFGNVTFYGPGIHTAISSARLPSWGQEGEKRCIPPVGAVVLLFSQWPTTCSLYSWHGRPQRSGKCALVALQMSTFILTMFSVFNISIQCRIPDTIWLTWGCYLLYVLLLLFADKRLNAAACFPQSNPVLCMYPHTFISPATCDTYTHTPHHVHHAHTYSHIHA